MNEQKRPKEHVADPRASWNAIRWVWSTFMDREGFGYAKQLALFATLFDAFRLIQPWIMGYGLAMIAVGDWNQTFGAFIAIVTAHALQDLCGWRVGCAREHLECHLEVVLEDAVTSRFLRKEMGLHIERHDLLCEAVMQKGRQNTLNVIKSLLSPVTENVPGIVITVVALVVVAPGPACFIIAVAILCVWMGTSQSRRLLDDRAPIDTRHTRTTRYRNERYDALERVKTNGKDEEEIHGLNTEFRETFADERRVSMRYVNAIQGRQAVMQVGYIAVVAYVGWQTFHGQRSIPDLVSVMSWSWALLAHARSLNMPARIIAKSTSGVLKLKEALELPARVTDTADARTLLPNEPLSISFEGVTHRYKEGASVLMDVSFTVEPGQRVALLGPSGAGKSTLVRLLQRFMDPSEGRITVNGTDLRQINLKSWQHLLAYIPQRPQVLDGTLRDNLLYGLDPHARAAFTDEKLWEMMKRFRVDFGPRLHLGLDTPVGKHGIELSGGEQQRVMIAAAAIRRPRFMIIDEATSSLDAESQRAVQDALDELLHDGTGAIVIAHRLSTVQHSCNRFVYLRPAGSEPNAPQVGAIADSMEELMELSEEFRLLALLEGVTAAKA